MNVNDYKRIVLDDVRNDVLMGQSLPCGSGIFPGSQVVNGLDIIDDILLG